MVGIADAAGSGLWHRQCRGAGQCINWWIGRRDIHGQYHRQCHWGHFGDRTRDTQRQEATESLIVPLATAVLQSMAAQREQFGFGMDWGVPCESDIERGEVIRTN